MMRRKPKVNNTLIFLQNCIYNICVCACVRALWVRARKSCRNWDNRKSGVLGSFVYLILLTDGCDAVKRRVLTLREQGIIPSQPFRLY